MQLRPITSSLALPVDLNWQNVENRLSFDDRPQLLDALWAGVDDRDTYCGRAPRDFGMLVDFMD
ncbi:MAG: hypothetical protein ACSLE8_06125 [Rhodococcus sp. (in: high G+C Gram-positive bacteria)]